MSAPQLPTVTVHFNALEIGYLMGAGFASTHAARRKGGWLERCKDPNEKVARSIYCKLKAAAIECGVEWYYGDPWDLSKDKPQP